MTIRQIFLFVPDELSLKMLSAVILSSIVYIYKYTLLVIALDLLSEKH